MKLTIICDDKAVYINGKVNFNLDFNNVPTNVHALQWLDIEGWIEFNNGNPNEIITEFPDWVNFLVKQWHEIEKNSYYFKSNPLGDDTTFPITRV